MDNQTLIATIRDALDNIKGQQIEQFDVSDLTPLTDCMIICTGTSSTHIRALADEVVVKVKAAGGQVTGVEGRDQAEWVLVDLGSVVVHLMLAATRSLYRLEDLWSMRPDQAAQQQSTRED